MASGVLGRADCQAHVDTVVYTVPASVLAVCNIALCNAGSGDARVRVALSKGAAPVSGEYIEYDMPLPMCASYERTGVALHAGVRVVVRADKPGVNAVVYGMEG